MQILESDTTNIKREVTINVTVPQLSFDWYRSNISRVRDTNRAKIKQIHAVDTRKIYAYNWNQIAIYVTDLEAEKYTLSKPVLIAVTREDEDEYIASFPQAEISRSGNTVGEAVGWLKSSMVELYELFKQEQMLGPLPRRQLQVLGEYIVAKPRTTK